MRADAAVEHRIAVQDQVLWRDRRGDVRTAGVDEVHRVGRRNMFEHNLQRGEVADEARQDALDKHRLAVEDIDVAVGHFAVHEQRHPDPLHCL